MVAGRRDISLCFGKAKETQLRLKFQHYIDD